jgi:small subunit ribosomal protein S5
METNKVTKTNNDTKGTFTPKFAPKGGIRRKPATAGAPGASSGAPSGSRKPYAGRGGRRPERVKPEFDQKIISIRRVTRVMAGGRRFSFSVAMLIGDKNGRVGFGMGKSNDTSLAINKALQDAKKHMVTIARTKNTSIPHEVEAKYKSSQIWLSPNKSKGLVSGAAIRDIFNLAGMTDVTAKIYSRSKNPINNVRATMMALAKLPKRKVVESTSNVQEVK